MVQRFLLAVAAFGLAACAADSAVDTESPREESALSTRALDMPFYFALPRSAIGQPPSNTPYRIVDAKPREASLAEHAGLHVIAVPDRPSTEGKREVRRQMARSLGAAGILRDGDVVVGVRFLQKDSVPYVHLQMGAQHTSLVFTRAGAAYHVDEPLDLEHMRFDPPASAVPDVRPRGSLGPPSSFRARKIVSQFDANAYVSGGTAGMPMLHIVRPRFVDDARKEALNRWIDRIGERWEYLQAAGVLRYNPNFLAPAAPRLGGTQKSVTLLGKTLLGEVLPDKLDMYCSELSWHLLALSNCSDDEIRSASEQGAACAADEPFALQPFASIDGQLGFGDGPLETLRQASLDARTTQSLLALLFPARGDESKLTNLHRRMSSQFRELVPVMRSHYEAALSGAGDPDASARRANTMLGDVLNYSPTSYLIEAIRSPTERKFDYVATIAFVDE